MARLALAAVLLLSAMPTVSRWLESRTQGTPDTVLAMCTTVGLAWTAPARLFGGTGKAPSPERGAPPDQACGYCLLLASLAPAVLLALAILLPLPRRAPPLPGLRPAPHAPPRLRGLGARGPPILL